MQVFDTYVLLFRLHRKIVTVSKKKKTFEKPFGKKTVSAKRTPIILFISVHPYKVEYLFQIVYVILACSAYEINSEYKYMEII